MQDRFKFRCWDRKNKHMVMDITNLADIDEADYILMQCVAVKDKNGKLIYEGDVVMTFVEYEPRKWKEVIPQVVEWWGSSFMLNNGYVRPFETCEVLGNIYENPNLLTNYHAKRITHY